MFYISCSPDCLNCLISKVIDSFSATLPLSFDPLCLQRSFELTNSTLSASGSSSHTEVVVLSYPTDEFNRGMAKAISSVSLTVLLTWFAPLVPCSFEVRITSQEPPSWRSSTSLEEGSLLQKHRRFQLSVTIR